MTRKLYTLAFLLVAGSLSIFVCQYFVSRRRDHWASNVVVRDRKFEAWSQKYNRESITTKRPFSLNKTLQMVAKLSSANDYYLFNIHALSSTVDCKR